LNALLDLPTTAPRRDWEGAPDQVRVGASAVPVWKWRVDSEVRRESRFAWLKTAGLAVLGMAVILIAGGVAFTTQRGRTPSPAQTAAPGQGSAPTVAQAAIGSVGSDSTPAGTRPAASGQAAAAVAASNSDTWVVQVGAFSTHDRSLAMVQRLTQSGFPAYEVPTEAGSRGLLYFVRVGPFESAGEADEARARLRQLTELENAFVRSVTSIP
jgi:cell division septation protein DedD